ncbi:MAG TPA: Tol-Pal system beta propeller repeat protein TolB [Gammaproteobacteria bacterium]|nr:Tol-Pal system beta propeller repeat protein TolB [Gammaproteobacteria bacterium]
MIKREHFRITKLAAGFGAAALIGLAALASVPAHAQLTIRITRGVERPVPIAIVPFGWEGTGPAPFDEAGLVSKDLENSGRFAPLPIADMVARPTQPTDVNFADWRATKVDVLVIGTLTQTGPDAYTIEFQLFDVLRARQLLGFRLTSDKAGLRATAHKIADMVFEKLTGIPGVFSTRIAYISQESDASGAMHYRLIVADADGANAAVVVNSMDPLMSPAWSPDGRRIAYVSFEGSRPAIYVQTLRTGNRERVSARPGVNGAPAFSPDGRMLALTLSDVQGNLDIFTLDLASQKYTRLTDSPAIDTEPSWSPDGKSIYFTSGRAGGPQIYRMASQPGSGQPQRITFEGSYNARPRVAPDGKHVAFVHRNDQGQDRIALADPATGLTQVLSDGRLDEDPDFAPNGAMLIYATRDKGKGVLEWVSSDGLIQQEIASGQGDVREPVWSPFPRP